MFIRKLSLVSFKNYAELVLELHPKLNCFVGDNGVGKTNLLDAAYYLCMCKSYFSSNDQFTIRTNDEFMILQAEFSKEEKKEELYCGLKKGKKKQFRRNRKEYERLSDHIGMFPVVMVSPNDIQLIIEGSEERRKYLNGVISQYDKLYLEQLIQYNRILAQRNRLLKDFREQGSQEDLLDILDVQIAASGMEIYRKRKDFISKFIPVFNEYYHVISGGNENVELQYDSQLDEGEFMGLLKESRSRDLMLQFTTTGIHKDDLTLNLDNNLIKRIGSQGQQKTYLVALKFAQFEFLRRIKKIPPLLLLDDVFDKLDAKRVKNILRLVDQESFGQIFITHTNQDRMKAILHELKLEHSLYRVEKGNVKLIGEEKNLRTEKKKP